MERQESQHSIRLKRAAAAAATSVGGGSSGGCTPAGLSSPGGMAIGDQAKTPTAAAATARIRQQPMCHFTFDFRQPDQMEDFRAQRLARKFREKIGAKCAKYELVAGFHLEDGVIISYHPFRTRVHFELTERRRKLLARYYRHGQQEVLLYVDRSEFEYYTPVCCYQPPEEQRSRSNNAATKRRSKGASATSCFAISGCAS